MERRWWRYAIAAATGMGVLSWVAHRSIYYPMAHPEGWWSLQSEIGAEDAEFQASDGVRLHGWYLNPPDAIFATLFLHGNAGNVTHRGPAMQEIARAGSAVLVVDYRGYGKSGGSPSEKGLYRDAEAGYNWLRKKGFEPACIVIHGESLGTAVATELAARLPCAGLVLEAPFTSASAVAGTVLPGIGYVLVTGYDSLSRMSGIASPLLVIHGDKDEIIPFRLGRQLFEAAREPKTLWIVPGGHHNDLLHTAGAEYSRRLSAFYAGLPKPVR